MVSYIILVIQYTFYFYYSTISLMALYTFCQKEHITVLFHITKLWVLNLT